MHRPHIPPSFDQMDKEIAEMKALQERALQLLTDAARQGKPTSAIARLRQQSHRWLEDYSALFDEKEC